MRKTDPLVLLGLPIGNQSFAWQQLHWSTGHCYSNYTTLQIRLGCFCRLESQATRTCQKFHIWPYCILQYLKSVQIFCWLAVMRLSSIIKAGCLFSWRSAGSSTFRCYIKLQLSPKPTKFSDTFFSGERCVLYFLIQCQKHRGSFI